MDKNLNTVGEASSIGSNDYVITSIGGQIKKVKKSLISGPEGASGTFTLNGVPAKITVPTGYTAQGAKSYLMIIAHGNGANANTGANGDMEAFCTANNIAFASIDGQDESVPPFTSNASGWGNYVHRQRYLNLYNYCMENFNFHDSVIFSAVSMGGLVMGSLAYYRPFPISFCLGIGPVPDLKMIFQATLGTDRKPAIRNAYGMDSGGADDANIEDFIQGYDWYTHGKFTIAGVDYKNFPTPLYMYLGTGDTTSEEQFGGISHYNEIRDMINRTGGYCYTKGLAKPSHADLSLWTLALTDGVFEKELGIVYTP